MGAKSIILRRYVKTIAVVASAHTGENPLFLVSYLMQVLRVVLLVSIWRATFAGRGSVSGYDLDAVLTYTLVAGALGPILECRTAIDSDLWQGTIATRFLRPMSVFGQYGAEAAGDWAFTVVFLTLPLCLLAPLSGISPAPSGLGAAALFAVSLPLALLVALAIDIGFGAVMILTGQNWYAIRQIRGVVALLLSGAVLPLAMYPWGIGRVLEWLPFASSASAPLRIWVGTGGWVLIVVQASWAAVLWPLAHLLWRVNRQRLVVYGG